jgi:hypothetical protein
MQASGAYDVVAAAALPTDGLALSGRWVHVYALRFWRPPPAPEAWASAAAALDAAWPWQGTVCDLVFDARETGRMVVLAPPSSTVVSEWHAEAPNTATWRWNTNFYGPTASTTPRLVSVPRPGLLLADDLIDLKLHPFIQGHDFAGLVMFSTTSMSERTGDTDTKIAVYMEWPDAEDGYSAVIDISVYDGSDQWVMYGGGSGWPDLYHHDSGVPDGLGGRLYALGWMIKDTAVSTWHVGETPGGARTPVKGSGIIVRGPYDTNREPEVTCYLDPRHVVIHEVRVVSPAPSPADWEALMQGVDAKWAAL